MAGDWIKVQTSLPQNPKVARIADELRIHEMHALGLLISFWSWADAQLVSGHAAGVSGKFIDRIVGCEGFTAALREVGWIEGEYPNIVLKNFEEHNGQTAKNRALSARRSAKYKLSSDAKGHAPSVTSVTLQASPREEKRREEYIPPVVPPSGGTSAGGSADIPNPPVMVPEDAARSWMAAMNAQGAGFTELDFQETFRLLHGTRDVRTGAWRVGRNGLVSDPRVILEQRLHDAQGRRLRSVTNPTASLGASASAFRQKISALQDELRNHKGNPDGSWPEHVRDANASAFQEKTRELNELTRRLSELNESVTGA